VERAFKATLEHWAMVVNYIETHPVLVKSKFANASGDNSDVHILWNSLINQNHQNCPPMATGIDLLDPNIQGISRVIMSLAELKMQPIIHLQS
jgi:hypothetical protein